MIWKEEYGHLHVNLVNQRLKQPFTLTWRSFSFALIKVIFTIFIKVLLAFLDHAVF